MNILVSACLLGVNCKYNGGSNLNSKVLELLNEHNIIPVCPEQLGGLATPRKPSEIKDGDGSAVLAGKAKVMNNAGEDVTAQFLKGAEEVLNMAKLYDCKAAVMKARSPSCGCGSIYDGTFSRRLKPGRGVTAQLLLDNGLTVMTEEEIENKLRNLK